MGSQRTYSKEFKLLMVGLVISGEKTPSQLCREKQLAKSVLYRWLQDFTSHGDAAFERRGLYQQKQSLFSPELYGGGYETYMKEMHTKTSEARIADLERLCGQLALENFFLKQTLIVLQQNNS